ncbi:1243_t:CDS:2 [Paraglomus brasilianum]|uniref:1243_t:CDS:1 n=1 Tax=Paraglomus brasilianum TaxID=144538 RepID=A0A9N9B8R1_9GLOM|nr:1243_t:CDS:2 [Paraglomus brasilianum]
MQQTEITPAVTTDESTPLLSSSNAQPSDNTTSPRPWYSRPSPFWLLPACSLIALSWGLMVAPRVNLYVEIVCEYYYASEANSIGFVGGLAQSGKLNGVDIVARTLAAKSSIIPSIIGIGGLPAIMDRFTFYQPGSNLSYYAPLESDDDDIPNVECNIPEVQAITSNLLLFMSLCCAVPCALGTLSDRKGRRIALLIATAGMTLNHCNIILVGTYSQTLGPYFLLFGALLEGLSGGPMLSLLAACHAYMSDCVEPERRSIVFGWLAAVIYLGVSLGPVPAGWIVAATRSYLSVFYIAVAVFISFFLFVLFILPESLTPEKQAENEHKQKLEKQTREHSSWWRRNVLSIFEALMLFIPKNADSKRHEDQGAISRLVRGNHALIFAAIMSCLNFVAFLGMQAVLILYTTLVFKWTVMDQGIFIFLITGPRAFVLMVLFPIIIRWLKRDGSPPKETFLQTAAKDATFLTQDTLTPEPGDGLFDEFTAKDLQARKALKFDIWALRFGFIIETISFIGYGLTPTGFGFYVIGIFQCLSAMVLPTIKSLLINLVPHSKTGEVLGATGVLEALMRILAPLLFNTIYSLTVSTVPHAVWLVIAALMGTGAVLSFCVKVKKIEKGKGLARRDDVIE